MLDMRENEGNRSATESIDRPQARARKWLIEGLLRERFVMDGLAAPTPPTSQPIAARDGSLAPLILAINCRSASIGGAILPSVSMRSCGMP